MRPQSLFFTLYGDYIWNYDKTIFLPSLITLMSQFGLTQQAIRAGLFRLGQAGLVKSERIGKFSRYSLSPLGIRHLEDGMRRVYEPVGHPWDGLWRLFVYTIAESRRERRDQVRRELQWHGMAPLARSTWISPNPVEGALRDMTVEFLSEDSAEIFISRWDGDESDLVRRLWNLARVGDAYSQFIDEWLGYAQEEVLSNAQAFIRRIGLVHAYRKFLNIDPNLPRDLLPHEWIGARARELFVTLHQRWTPRADSYFKSVYEP